jgi:hypothetical protein
LARYLFDITGSNPGSVQHVVQSKQTGLMADMTIGCALRKWVR